MNIGIDIDDTITNTSLVIKDFLIKYDEYYCSDKHLINSINDIMKGNIYDEDVRRFYVERSIEMASTYELIEGALEIINKLKEEGNRIIIITARSDNYYRNSYDFCFKYLTSKGILFDKLITSAIDKAQICKDENIDIMIDDSISACEGIERIGTEAIVFNSNLNIDKKTRCKRVDSWYEIYNYIHSKNKFCKILK